MPNQEKLTSTPEFSTNEPEKIYVNINEHLTYDVDGLGETPTRYDAYTGTDLVEHPEQSKCRKNIINVTAKIHSALGVDYEADESPISGRSLPTLPDLRGKGVQDSDYGPYLERVYVLKKDLRDVVDGVEQRGEQVPSFDSQTGVKLPNDSLKKFKLCASHAPQATTEVISGLKQQTLNTKIEQIRSDVTQGLEDDFKKIQETNSLNEAELTEKSKILDQTNNQPEVVSSIVPQQSKEEMEASVGNNSLEVTQQEALTRFAEGFGMEVTPELQHAYDKGGVDAVTELYFKEARAKLTETQKSAEQEMNRELEIIELQKEVNEATYTRATETIRNNNPEEQKRFKLEKAAVNNRFATEPNGNVGDLGTMDTIRILEGEAIANDLITSNPDIVEFISKLETPYQYNNYS
jgi:hypothetical protein